MRSFFAAALNKKYFFVVLASTALVFSYQACSQDGFEAHRSINSLSTTGELFSLSEKTFPVCSGERTLVVTYNKSIKETHVCFDDTRLASSLSLGLLCESGLRIETFTTEPMKAQPCTSTTLCGVTPQVSEVSLGASQSPGTQTYKMTYHAVPLGCTGGLRIEDDQKKVLQSMDIETPGTKESLCNRCSNGQYSCGCLDINTNMSNGVCGVSNGGTYPVAPTTNLCIIGTNTIVLTNMGKFEWTCFGMNGGTNSYCSASDSSYIGGLCGSANGGSFSETPATGLCSKGTATDVIVDDFFFKWSCNGQSGAPSINCSGAKFTPVTVVTGACGPSNGQTFQSGPSTNLCGTGTPSGVTTNTNSFSWTCSGSNGGTTAQCSATLMAATQPINGTCGSRQGQILSFLASNDSGLCGQGTPTSFASASNKWTWNCNGSNDGSTASCSATYGYTCGNVLNGTCPTGQTCAFIAHPGDDTSEPSFYACRQNCPTSGLMCISGGKLVCKNTIFETLDDGTVFYSWHCCKSTTSAIGSADCTFKKTDGH